MSPPIVTIIIPAYNYGRYLGQALDSLLAQTLREWECLVVDDCSSDNTVAVAGAYAARDQRIRCIFQKRNQGPNAARNRGLAFAQGRYVQFLDADDRLEQNKLRVQASFLDANPDIDLVYGPARYFYCPSEFPGQPTEVPVRLPRVSGEGEELLTWLVADNFLVVNAPLFRLKLAQRAGGCDPGARWVEDWDFWLRCALVGGRFRFLEVGDDAALVRRHDASASRDRLAMLHSALTLRQGLRLRLPAQSIPDRINDVRLARVSFALASLYITNRRLMPAASHFIRGCAQLARPTTLIRAIRMKLQSPPASSPSCRPQLCYLYRNPVHFVRLDARLLAENWDVAEVRFTFSPLVLWRLWRAVRRADLVFVWFGNVWAAAAVWFARLSGKKSVVVAGGYDADIVPEIGYGLPLHPVLRHFARYAFTHASLVLPVSLYMERMLRAFCHPQASLLVPNAVDLPDVAPDINRKEQMVLTIGLVHKGSSPIKGHYLFLEVAARLPEVPFVLYGRQTDATADELRQLAPPNVTLVDDAGRESLLDHLLRAKVYAQFSATESFGVALVEAMWCGCTPVVTPRGALPEMIGNVGLVAESLDPDRLAAAVRQALAREPAVNSQAIELARVYTIEARQKGLRRMAAQLGF